MVGLGWTGVVDWAGPATGIRCFGLAGWLAGRTEGQDDRHIRYIRSWLDPSPSIPFEQPCYRRRGNSLALLFFHRQQQQQQQATATAPGGAEPERRQGPGGEPERAQRLGIEIDLIDRLTAGWPWLALRLSASQMGPGASQSSDVSIVRFAPPPARPPAANQRCRSVIT